MSRTKTFIKERDAMLRSLDEAEFDRFARNWDLPQPAQWAAGAKLASMHKARINLDAFAPHEKELSRKWLADNGFTEKAGSGAPCPECGGKGFSRSNCRTCGMAP